MNYSATRNTRDSVVIIIILNVILLFLKTLSVTWNKALQSVVPEQEAVFLPGMEYAKPFQ